MNKKIIISIAILIIIAVIIFSLITKNNSNENITNPSTNINNMGTEITSDNPPEKTEGMTVVPTMRDIITTDASWCGTFQLVWNDMKNEVVKQDVVFTPQEEMVTNLNKEEFKASMISDEYYFKKYGLKSLELK